jgi:nucleotide-binding universal stress UspA family protein
MKKLLLPTDFSENARNAIEYAINMFGCENAEYILLNVWAEPSTTADMLRSINDLLEKQSIEDLTREEKYLRAKFPEKQLNIECRSDYGELSFVINGISERENIDFVVMGTKGASGLKKFFAGSNTAAVVASVKCPVLAIPEKVNYKPPVRIAFAADYEELENHYILSPLSDLCRQYGSELMIVNIQPEGELINADHAVSGIALHNVWEDISHDFFTIENSDIAEALSGFIEENDADLLVMVARQRNFFNRIFRSSVTRQMSMLAKVPLLVLPEK